MAVSWGSWAAAAPHVRSLSTKVAPCRRTVLKHAARSLGSSSKKHRSSPRGRLEGCAVIAGLVLSRSRRLWRTGSVPSQVRVALRSTATAAEATTEEEQTERSASKRPSLRLPRSEGGGVSNFMITTPLFYANGPPHIGSAYPAIAADVMARYAKLRGADNHFVTGMDEHGEKIAKTADGKGKSPQQLVDAHAADFQALWEMLRVQPDHFARTTLDKHKEIVNEMWQRCLAKGDIYKKDYTGWYCVGCEAYLDEDEMEGDHICKIHQKKAEKRSEENYFFRLSKYWDDVRKLVENNPDFILPTTRRSQVLAWLHEDNKRDFSISRASTSWGIPVPGDDSQVIYVWFDALLGYLSSLLRPEDPATLEAVLTRGWPAQVHLIGKDIMRFHAIYWPAMLMSADLPLPKHICTHGFLTRDGLKMGKSLGNVVEPVPLVETFGSDAVRYFFSSCLAFGEDGDFSYKGFITRINSDLANSYSNLVHRLLTLCRKNLSQPTSATEMGLTEEQLADHPVRVAALRETEAAAAFYEQMDIPKASMAALRIVGVSNARIVEVEPWKKLKKDCSEEEQREALREMLVMAEGVRICAILLSPVMPELSRNTLEELGVWSEGALSWRETSWCWEALPGLAVSKKPTPLFMRIDKEAWEDK
eukprot:TRINITY_DN62381_c0_g1_i1.p1 TRINITY_DN62381_c0_g1~~TRINITY_DN62381_c0_g1_i1.p1  ORF type:complete len:656 (+),score=131.93 TRINITY_DN62381_c0_g1_i1:29-1969(+)